MRRPYGWALSMAVWMHGPRPHLVGLIVPFPVYSSRRTSDVWHLQKGAIRALPQSYPIFYIHLSLLPYPPTGSLLSHALVSLPPLTRWHPTQNSSSCGAQKCTTLLDSHICAPTLLIPGTTHEGTGTMAAKLNDRRFVLRRGIALIFALL